MATRKNTTVTFEKAKNIAAADAMNKAAPKRSAAAKRADPVPVKAVSANRSIAAKASAAKRQAAKKESKPVKIVKKVAVKKPAILKFRGYVLPLNRKNESVESVPTIDTLKSAADLSKLLSKLPKGVTFLTIGDDLGLYNKQGAAIAHIHCK